MATIENDNDLLISSQTRNAPTSLTPDVIAGNGNLGDGSVDSRVIENLAIRNSHIENLAVDTIKMKNGAVTDPVLITLNTSYTKDITRKSQTNINNSVVWSDYAYWSVPNITQMAPYASVIAAVPFFYPTIAQDREIKVSVYMNVDYRTVGSSTWTLGYVPATTIMGGFHIKARRFSQPVIHKVIAGEYFSQLVTLAYGGAMLPNKQYRIRVGFAIAEDIFEQMYSLAANTLVMKMGPLINFVITNYYK